MAEAEATAGTFDEVAPGARHSPLGLAVRRLLRKRIAVLALAFIAVFYFSGLFAPVVAPRSYTKQDLDNVLQAPSLAHPLGTDRLGRDMLSRVIWASRTTVIVTLATLVTGGLVLSVSLGLLAGYLGGKVDTAIMRVGDVFFALPGLPMLILINATLKPRVVEQAWVKNLEDWLRVDGLPDYILIFGALSLFAWVGGARVIRSQILALRETEYVVAARAMGASTWRVIFRHLLPNVSNIIIVGLSASLGAIAGTEIALTWFGVGIQPPTPSFGAMLFEGGSIRTLQANPHLLLVPGAVVAALIFAFNLLGDALTDVLTPRAR
jgi:ABC-type dipeptide/oligopeptide/nickel transport system permease subunit